MPAPPPQVLSRLAGDTLRVEVEILRPEHARWRPVTAAATFEAGTAILVRIINRGGSAKHATVRVIDEYGVRTVLDRPVELPEARPVFVGLHDELLLRNGDRRVEVVLAEDRYPLTRLDDRDDLADERVALSAPIRVAPPRDRADGPPGEEIAVIADAVRRMLTDDGGLDRHELIELAAQVPARSLREYLRGVALDDTHPEASDFLDVLLDVRDPAVADRAVHLVRHQDLDPKVLAEFDLTPAQLAMFDRWVAEHGLRNGPGAFWAAFARARTGDFYALDRIVHEHPALRSELWSVNLGPLPYPLMFHLAALAGTELPEESRRLVADLLAAGTDDQPARVPAVPAAVANAVRDELGRYADVLAQRVVVGSADVELESDLAAVDLDGELRGVLIATAALLAVRLRARAARRAPGYGDLVAYAAHGEYRPDLAGLAAAYHATFHHERDDATVAFRDQLVALAAPARLWDLLLAYVPRLSAAEASVRENTVDFLTCVLDETGQNPPSDRDLVDDAPPVPGREVTAALVDATVPLQSGRPVQLVLRIEAPLEGVDSADLDVTVLAIADGADVRPPQRRRLIAAGEGADDIRFEVTPTREGLCELRLRLYTTREYHLLRELTTELPVTRGWEWPNPR